MTKKKLLIRIGSMRGGGAEKVLLYLLKNLDYSEYEVDVLLNIKHGVYINEIPKEVRLLYIGTGGEYVPSNFIIQNINKIRNLFLEKCYTRFPKFLYSYKLKKNYDIEIGFMQGLIRQIATSPNEKSKKIVWVHANIEKDESKNDLLTYHSRIDEIAAVSHQAEELIINLLPTLREKTHCIYNPLDVEEIKKLAELPPETSFPKSKNKDTVKLLAVGTIYKIKGYERLIEAHALLKETGILSEVYILGVYLKEEYLEELKQLTKKLKVSDTVHFLGFKKNPYPYMAQCDVFVCSSHAEGFSLVVAEAMLLGKPIVSTNIPGPDELLNYGEYGILTESSAEGLYKGIKEIIENKEVRDQFHEKLGEHIHRFDGKQFMDQVNQLLKKYS